MKVTLSREDMIDMEIFPPKFKKWVRKGEASSDDLHYLAMVLMSIIIRNESDNDVKKALDDAMGMLMAKGGQYSH
jgi:thiamine phosphate synthase YjbQ (UPF0047 family)